ncbi:AAA family ATPase [Candidatus Uhrbacteria bacterium]|nr:AAA family ATPase [Candidatus Uhrbacteria bacterium]
MISHPYPFKFVVIEGIDGVGKTTLTKLLVERLNERSRAVRFEDVPFQNPTSTLKRGIEDGDQEISFFTYVLSALHKDRHLRQLLQTQHVIADRWFPSVLAHHEARGVDTQVLNLDRLPLIAPDHLFLLTAQESVRRARLEARGILDEKDRRVREPGSELARIETVFKRVIPTQVDTTLLSADTLLTHILAHMHFN